MTCRLLGVILEESTPEELQVLIVHFNKIKLWSANLDLCDFTLLVAERRNCEVLSFGSTVGDNKIL